MKRTRSDSDCACKLCLFDQSQKLKQQQQQQQHKKKLQGLFLAPDEKTYQDNIVNTFVQFYAGIFVRHMQSLRLFLVYGSGFKVQ